MAEAPSNVLPIALTTTPATLLTAGAAGTWIIVRKLTVVNVTNSVHQVTIGIGISNTDTGDATGLAKRLWHSVDVQPGRPIEREGFAVLLGGASPQLLYAFCDTASALNIALDTWTGP